MIKGAVIAGRYQFVEPIGHGAMGEVWRAEDMLLGRTVAIKTLPRVTPNDEEMERARREARVAAGLQNPHTVSVFDVVIEDGRPFLVMEYVEGESLAHVLESEGSLDPDRAARIISEIANGLAAAHALGVVHRDIKPANVLLTPIGTAKLADFGIARGPTDSSLTQTGQMVGTVAFMAPEVARGDPATPASDVWSLGATMFACVEGHPPFAGVNAPNATAMLLRLVSERPPPSIHAGPYREVIAAMLTVDPVRRPSADAVIDQLLVAEAGGPTTKTGAAFRSRRGWLFAGALSSVAAVTAAILIGNPFSSHGHPAAGSIRTGTSSNTRPSTSGSSASDSPVDFTKAPRTLVTGYSPGAAAATPDGKHLWIIADGTSLSSGHPDGEADIFALPSFTPERHIRLGPRPEDIAFSADGSTAYIPEIGADSGLNGHLDVVNVKTGGIHRITVGPYPVSVALSRDGQFAFVANANLERDSLYKVNLHTGTSTVLANISQAETIVPSRDARTLFVLSVGAVTAVSADSGKVLWSRQIIKNSIALCGANVCVGTAPPNVAGLNPVSVTMFDAASGRTVADQTLAVSTNSIAQVNAMTCSTDGKTLYASYDSSADPNGPPRLAILSVDASSLKLLDDRTLGKISPVGLAYFPGKLITLPDPLTRNVAVFG